MAAVPTPDDDDLTALVHGPGATAGDDAAAARSRERWLRQEAEDGATFEGLLCDLADLGAGVTVSCHSGSSHAGRVVEVAAGCFVLALGDGARAVLEVGAVAAVRPDPDHRLGAAAGNRVPPSARTIDEVLRSELDRRPRIRVVSAGGPPLTGRLLAVGLDVVTVALEGADRSVCYIPSSSLSEVVLFASG